MRSGLWRRDKPPDKSSPNCRIDILAGEQAEAHPEAFIDALIRFSLLAWQTEIDAHPPPWYQVQDRIFSELSECRNLRK